MNKVFYILMCMLTLMQSVCSAGVVYSGCVLGGSYYVEPSATDYTQDANCVGAWYMNSSATTETDRSGNSANLTFGGTPVQSSDVPSGFSGNSLDFEKDDAADYLTMADGGSTDIYGDPCVISIVAWVKPESLTGGVYSNIVAKYGAGVGYQWRLGTLSLRFIAIMDQNTGSYNDSNETAGQWYHLAMVADGSKLYLYINGVVNPTSWDVAAVSNTNTTFNIGASSRATPDEFFDGLIDEVAVFNRALSSEEITEIMTYGIDGTNGANG